MNPYDTILMFYFAAPLASFSSHYSFLLKINLIEHEYIFAGVVLYVSQLKKNKIRITLFVRVMKMVCQSTFNKFSCYISLAVCLNLFQH